MRRAKDGVRSRGGFSRFPLHLPPFLAFSRQPGSIFLPEIEGASRMCFIGDRIFFGGVVRVRRAGRTGQWTYDIFRPGKTNAPGWLAGKINY